MIDLFLFIYSIFKKKPKEVEIIDEIEETPKVKEKSYMDRHFFCHEEIVRHYKLRKEFPSFLLVAIHYCEQQIEIAPKVIEETKNDPSPWENLPRHHGYLQLAIIRFKEKNYDEVIRLCKQAKAEGWNGDWDKRIERAQKKIDKGVKNEIK